MFKILVVLLTWNQLDFRFKTYLIVDARDDKKMVPVEILRRKAKHESR